MSTTVVTLNTVITFVLLTIVVVYNHIVIKPNAHRAHWKCRRATSGWFFFYIFTVTLNDFLRCFICLLRSYEVLGDCTYALLLKPTTYYGSLTFASIRVWFLWFDLRKNRASQRFLLSQKLNSALYGHVKSSASNTSLKNNKLGNSKRATIAVFLVATVFLAIALGFDLMGLTSLAALVPLVYVVLAVVFYTYFLLSFGCCSGCCTHGTASSSSNLNTMQSSFRDDCAVLTELKLFYVWWWIGAISGFALLLPVSVFDERYPPYLSITVVVSRIVVLTLIFGVPYRIGRVRFAPQLDNGTRANKAEKARAKMHLQNILCRRAYFFAFVEHLVQEMSVENLTFLVEVWQFKNEQKYGLTANADDADVVVDDQLIDGPDKVALTWDNASAYALPTMASRAAAQSNTSIDRSTTLNSAQRRHLVTMLMAFRWAELPVARSIAKHADDKWSQCRVLFEKYIQDQSMECINISFNASDVIQHHFMLCSEYAQNKHGNHCELLNWNVSADAANDDHTDAHVPVEEEIQDDHTFQRTVMCLFDFALSDVFENLNDALQRFLRSKEFEALQ